MISLDEACKIAVESLVRKDYLRAIVEITDIGDRWIFSGKLFEGNAPEYGNCPCTVNKETGECEEFPFSVVENFDRYYDGEDVEVPEKYRYWGGQK